MNEKQVIDATVTHLQSIIDAAHQRKPIWIDGVTYVPVPDGFAQQWLKP